MEPHCTYVIEGPRDALTRKVWWRRYCKRKPEPGTDRCWQHRLPPHPEDRNAD